MIKPIDGWNKDTELTACDLKSSQLKTATSHPIQEDMASVILLAP